MQLAIFPKDYYSFAHRVDITLRGILLGRGINMKKWNWHSYAAGMVSAVLIVGMATPALADVVGQMSQNQVNIIANGATISSAGQNYTLESGNEVPSSITFTDSSGGGTVYLPVRRVSQILGVEIGWDGARNAVVIGGESVPIQDVPNQNQSTNVQSGDGVRYYSRYPGVPDFGAFAGINESDIGSLIGSPGYYYDVLDVDEALGRNPDLLLDYHTLLGQCGFSYIGDFEGDTGVVECYSNGTYSIGVGLTDKRFFAILVLEQ